MHRVFSLSQTSCFLPSVVLLLSSSSVLHAIYLHVHALFNVTFILMIIFYLFIWLLLGDAQ